MGKWLFHISVLISLHLCFLLSLSSSLRVLLDMNMILLSILSVVQRLDLSVEILSFFNQRASFLSFRVLEFSITALLVVIMSFAMVLLSQLSGQPFDLILLLIYLLSS